MLVPHHGTPQNALTAREVLERGRARAMEIDNTLKDVDIQFTQDIEFKSRGGDRDELIFNITIKHGKFERQLVSTTVANGDRFNGGYDAFDKMFLLSEYFDDHGKKLTSCEFSRDDQFGQGADNPEGTPSAPRSYEINFTYSKSSDVDDPLNVVSASLTANDFTPMSISEQINGLPLGAEFDNDVKVTYDKNLNINYPENIVMHVYAHLFFLKGEIAVVTIKNKNLKRI